VPLGQGVHFAAPAAEILLPVHGLHDDEPSVENEPARQVVQIAAPADEAVPAGQLTQLTVPGEGANVPAAHCEHALEPTAEKFPAGQSV